MADGTRVYEPPDGGANVANVDSKEIDYGSGDLRDRQRMLLAGQGVGTDVAVTDADPAVDAMALVVRSLLASGDLDRIAPATGIDPDNSTLTPLAAAGEFTGTFKSAAGLNSMLVFAISDAPLTTARIEWSPDGVNPTAGIIGTSSLLGSVQVIEAGPITYHIYISVISTVVDKFYRLKLVNGATPVTALFQANTWTYDEAFPGSYGPLTSDLNTFSVALLTRAVQAGVDPDDKFKNLRAQGRHTLNSTVIPLNGDTGGSDHIFRGQWVQWQDEPYIGMVVDLHADVDGELFIDLSEEEEPVDGDESSVVMSIQTEYHHLTDPLFRRTYPLQSRWVRVRYLNGTTAQSVLQLDTAFLTGSNAVSMAPMGVLPRWTDLGTQSRTLALLESSAEPMTMLRPTATPQGGKVGADTHLSGIDVSLPQRALGGFRTGQGAVTSVEAIPFPPTPMPDRAGVLFINTDPEVLMYYSEDADKLPDQGGVLLPLSPVSLDIDPGSQVFWQIADQGGSATTSEVPAASTNSNVGVLDPNNMLAAGDARAVLDSTGDTVSLTGFDSPRLHDAIGTLKIHLEGRKSASPVTETVQAVDVTTGTGGNVGSVTTTGQVPYNALHQYVVAVSRRNAAAVVSTVVGMGVGWVQVADVAAANGESRISLWIPTTQPTGAGSVGASFSALPTNSVIGVYRFSGVDLSAPIQASETLTANNSAYSDAISGTALGRQAVFAAMRERTHAPGSGFTELHETRTGSGVNDASLAMSSDPFAATGSEPYSGTFSGNVGWSLVAIALKPADTYSPVVRVRYQIGAGPIGATFLTAPLATTADAPYEVDITADRTWTFDDIDALTLLVDVLSIGAAPAEVDRISLLETDVESGNSARLAWTEIGGVL